MMQTNQFLPGETGKTVSSCHDDGAVATKLETPSGQKYHEVKTMRNSPEIELKKNTAESLSKYFLP